MVLIEAAAKVVLLISFDIETGPSEIILDGVVGFLIPEIDVNGVAPKLELLMADLEKRAGMVAAIYAQGYINEVKI